MRKYSREEIERFNEKVICEYCGKQMSRGQKACGFRDIVCVECARNGYKDKRRT